MINVEKIKKDFPILQRKVNGKVLVYLDNAATSQKPKQVIQAISDYYEKHNANVHRGIHSLSDEASEQYQKARENIARFIGAKDASELIFVRNTTEAINLAAYSWGRENIGKGDLILTSEMEHHSNMLPWQRLAKQKGARVEYVNVTSEGLLDMKDFNNKLKLRPKIFAIVHVSNFLGTMNDVKSIVNRAKSAGVKVLVDGAQAVPHMPVDVKKLGVDFYAFSGHKMLGPMGIGGLWIRKELMEEMQPFLVGGGMISEVYFDKVKYAQIPDRFEAGTPDVAGALGLAVAVDYLSNIGMDEIREHERKLTKYTLEQLRAKRKELGVRVFGLDDIDGRGGVVSFVIEGVHAHDVAQVLDSEGVAVRSGHHCTMPMHVKLKIPASVRASFALYNTQADVDRFIEGLSKVKRVFGV